MFWYSSSLQRCLLWSTTSTTRFLKSQQPSISFNAPLFNVVTSYFLSLYINIVSNTLTRTFSLSFVLHSFYNCILSFLVPRCMCLCVVHIIHLFILTLHTYTICILLVWLTLERDWFISWHIITSTAVHFYIVFLLIIVSTFFLYLSCIRLRDTQYITPGYFIVYSYCKQFYLYSSPIHFLIHAYTKRSEV